MQKVMSMLVINKSIINSTLCVLVSLIICSCSYNDIYSNSNKKVDIFFSWVEQGNFDSVYTLFGKNLYNKSDSIVFRESLLNLNKKGRIISIKNYSVKHRTEYANGNKIIYTQVRYKVHYANDSIMFFSFVFGKDKFSDNKLISVVLNNDELK